MSVTSTAFAVRRARASDFPEVVRLWREGARHHLGLAGYADDLPEMQLLAEGRAWAREYLEGRDRALFIALDAEGAGIGLLSAHVSSRSILHKDPRIVTAGDAFVDPAWRRRGVLRALVGALEGWAVRARAVAAVADYAADNETAAEAWAALGYAPESIHVRKDLRRR